MFDELYDYISLWFSWRWPKADGVITAAYLNLDTGREGAQATVAYEFSVGGDGPYTGESPWFGDTVYLNSLIGQAVTVRYRKGDPSVNKLDDSGGI
jgi:hypothetical protein